MTDFHFSLSFDSFVAFLGATLEISGDDSPRVRLSIEGIHYRYEGDLGHAIADRFCDLAVAALRSYPTGAAWSNNGLDGTDYRGSFESSSCPRLEFRFWSPSSGTPPHSLARAALEAVPLDHPDEGFEYSLEKLREGLGIGVPLRLQGGTPPRVRVIGNLPLFEPVAIESILRGIAPTRQLIVDLRLSGSLSDRHVRAFRPLAERQGPTTWLCREDHVSFLTDLRIPSERTVVLSNGEA